MHSSVFLIFGVAVYKHMSKKLSDEHYNNEEDVLFVSQSLIY